MNQIIPFILSKITNFWQMVVFLGVLVAGISALLFVISRTIRLDKIKAGNIEVDLDTHDDAPTTISSSTLEKIVEKVADKVADEMKKDDLNKIKAEKTSDQTGD